MTKDILGIEVSFSQDAVRGGIVASFKVGRKKFKKFSPFESISRWRTLKRLEVNARVTIEKERSRVALSLNKGRVIDKIPTALKKGEVLVCAPSFYKTAIEKLLIPTGDLTSVVPDIWLSKSSGQKKDLMYIRK